MRFKDIAIKNFRYNFRRYIAYFLCSSFNVLILTIYAMFYFNDSIRENVAGTTIEMFMKASLGILAIFCFTFISYINGSFMRERNEEFGLFLTLGLTKKHIDKIIRVENSIISIGSFVLGIVSGTILSRLFFMLSTKMLDFEDMVYSINIKAYGVTLILYMGINMVMYIKRKFYIYKLELAELIKESRKVRQGKSSWIVGLVGVLLIATGYICSWSIVNGTLKNGNFLFIAFIFMAIGIYFVISNFGALVIKSNKKRYYKHIISLSSINYRFIGYRKILYSITMLSGMVIFCIGVCYTIYSESMKKVDDYNPYHIMYMEMADRDSMSSEELAQIVDEEASHITEAKTLDFIHAESIVAYDKDGKGRQRETLLPIISESVIRDHLDSQLADIEPGHVVSLRSRDDERVANKKKENLKIKIDGDRYLTYSVREQIYQVVCNEGFSRVFYNQLMFILDDGDYDTLMEQHQLEQNTLHLYNFNSPQVAEKVLRKIMAVQYDEEKARESIFRYHYDKKSQVVSNLVERKANMADFGYLLFITSLIGCLFFISSGVMLYFKTFTGMEEAKKRYAMLYKTGITYQDIKGSITYELRPVFFIPIILGGALGIGFICTMFARGGMFEQVLVNTLYLMVLYLLSSSVFYFIAKSKYLRTILAHLNM